MPSTTRQSILALMMPAALLLGSAAQTRTDLSDWYGVRLGDKAPSDSIGVDIAAASQDVTFPAPQPWDVALASTDDRGRATGLTFIIYGVEAMSDRPANYVPPRLRSVAAMRSLAKAIVSELRGRLGPPNRPPEMAGERRWALAVNSGGAFRTANLYVSDDIITLAINPPELPTETMDGSPIDPSTSTIPGR